MDDKTYKKQLISEIIDLYKQLGEKRKNKIIVHSKEENSKKV